MYVLYGVRNAMHNSPRYIYTWGFMTTVSQKEECIETVMLLVNRGLHVDQRPDIVIHNTALPLIDYSESTEVP